MSQLRNHYRFNRQRMLHFRFRANQRVAKERIRLKRAAREEPMPDTSHVRIPRPTAALFVVSVRCRDGHSVSLRIHEAPWGGLTISPTAVAKKVASVVRHYRPEINPMILSRTHKSAL